MDALPSRTAGALQVMRLNDPGGLLPMQSLIACVLELKTLSKYFLNLWEFQGRIDKVLTFHGGIVE